MDFCMCFSSALNKPTQLIHLKYTVNMYVLPGFLFVSGLWILLVPYHNFMRELTLALAS